MSNSNEQLFKEVFDLIDGSGKMGYQWFQKTDDIKHTGMVIKFDKTPKYILEFGMDESKLETKIKLAASAASGYLSPTSVMQSFAKMTSLPGKKIIQPFYADGIKVVGKLVEMPLTNQAERENAKNLFIHISNIDMGKYNVVTNNCRTYVVVIAHHILFELPEMKDADWNAFETKMQTLMSEDQMKFEDCRRFVKNVIAGRNYDPLP